MSNKPLISIIITCYNHGRYIPKAINSVLEQDYSNMEIIVIDDGSTDNTREQAALFSMVKYVYQTNQGLSAARNTGILNSSGEFLIFLDADDWLAEDAISTNLSILKAHPEAAFVSGGHIKISHTGVVIEDVRTQIESNHYINLLQGNYIGMHATVLYRRWVFDHFLYDTSLNACEDYDLYLKISKSFPVVHHSQLIAYYLIHGHNMSADKSLMLTSVLNVLNRQESQTQTAEEKTALQKGREIWTEYYSPKNKKPNNNVAMLKRIKKYTPDFAKRVLSKLGLIKTYIPKPGHIIWGDLNRVKPFSIQFGYDRGGPVDRYYIESFLEINSNKIHGRVLEIGDNDYTLRFGGNKITKSDILHIDPNNSQATIIGDLSNAPQIADNTYDCIILTQTLHLIYDFHAAIKTCYRVLKPGGTLLMTVPGITHIDQGEWNSNWLWAFTGSSISRIINDDFPSNNTCVNTYGNVHIAAAFLYGAGVNEVKKKHFEYHDPHYQVIITALAVKSL